MKNKVLLFLFMIACMCSCNSSSSIEYVPCKVDGDGDWGFVNANGEVFCEDMFENVPTIVQEGVFFVKEGELYVMYQFDKKQPKPILEDIKSHGVIVDGLVPICKKESRIEVVDAAGKTKFMLNKIENYEVESTAVMFSYGYLEVVVRDNQGNKLSGLVNKSGKVVLKPKYDSIIILGEDLFLVKETDESSAILIDKNGKEQKQWKKDLKITDYFADHIVAEYNDRFYIYDKKGNEVLKCPSKVENVTYVQDDLFVFEDANSKSYSRKKGVMNMDGETILSSKYEYIDVVEGGFIVRKSDDKDIECLDKNGELIQKLSDYKYVFNLPDFSNVALEGRLYRLLDNNYKPVNKVEFDNLYLSYGKFTTIESDYFEYAAVISSLDTALKGKLASLRAGMTVNDITLVTSKGVGAYGKYADDVTIELAEGLKYTVKAELNFTNKILSPVYKEKKVEKFHWYYGSYTTTETVVDSYKFNNKAKLKGYKIFFNVPSDKEEQLHKELLAYFEKAATKNDNDEFFKDGYVYELRSLGIIWVTPPTVEAND